MKFNVIFGNRSALVQFNLENVNNAGWMGEVVLEVQVDYKTVSQTKSIRDINSKEQKVSGLNFKDRVCLVFKIESVEQNRICEIFMDETEPGTWKPADIELSVTCKEATAKVTLNLIKLDARWMEVLRKSFTYGDRVSESGQQSDFLAKFYHSMNVFYQFLPTPPLRPQRSIETIASFDQWSLTIETH